MFRYRVTPIWRVAAVLAGWMLAMVSMQTQVSMQAQVPGASPKGTGPRVAVPAGTQVAIVAIRPVWAATAKAQDPIYVQTTFPVTEPEGMAIPPGTYVLGSIVDLIRATPKVNKAVLRISFTKLIYADGYTVSLPADEIMDETVQVNTANDLLLDNGTAMEMTVSSPLSLSLKRVTAAIPVSHAPVLKKLKTATKCVSTPGTPSAPGTPGTPDTVIPGTPDTVIPGADGMPDTVIPGVRPTTIPGTPGTPGDPGTPGYQCPNPPLMTSSMLAGTTPLAAPAVVAKKKKGARND